MLSEVKGIIYPDITKPIYLQLRDILVNEIETGKLRPGDSLPGERVIAEMYDISRVTVRKCIGGLVEEGYLVRSQGRETTVAQRKVNHHLGRLVGSIEEFLSTDAVEVSIDVIRKGFEKGSVSVRKHLELSDEDRSQIYSFSRRINKSGQPLAVNFSFVPFDIGKIVDTLDLKSAKVFVCLENAGYNLSYGEQEITAAICSKEEAGYLSYEVGQAILVIRRTTYLENGYPILYEKTIYRGDNYQYSIRLQRRI